MLLEARQGRPVVPCNTLNESSNSRGCRVGLHQRQRPWRSIGCHCRGFGEKREGNKIAPAILNVINALYELHKSGYCLSGFGWGLVWVFVTLGISIVQMSYLIACNAVHSCCYEI